MERMFPAPGPITLTVDPTPGLFFPVWHSQVRWWESGDCMALGSSLWQTQVAEYFKGSII